jgi:hypothetical protein
MLRTLLISFSFLTFFSFSSFTQLDSLNVTANFGYENAIDFDGDSVLQKTVIVETWINDFDFFGEIIITVYDQEANFPVDKQKFTKQQVSDLNMINSGVITIKSFNIEENRSYRIEAIVSNYQGLYLPVTESILTAN